MHFCRARIVNGWGMCDLNAAVPLFRLSPFAFHLSNGYFPFPISKCGFPCSYIVLDIVITVQNFHGMFVKYDLDTVFGVDGTFIPYGVNVLFRWINVPVRYILSL